MRVSVAVCDDLEEERITLARMIRQYGEAHSLALELETAASGEELLARFRPRRWDVVFLDIYMGAMSGVEAAGRLRAADRDCAVVFATTSREHGLVSYDLGVVDYLLKPFAQERVDAALDWLLQERESQLRTLSIRTNWEDAEVRLRDVRYIEIRRNVAILSTEQGELATRRTMEDLAAEIGGGSFFRSHRSYLVNLDHVTGVGKGEFYMDDGASVPIAAARQAEAKQTFLEWALEKNWGKK